MDDSLKPNFGKTHRIKKGGPKIHILDMTNKHILNSQKFLREMLYYYDKFHRPLTGNIKDRKTLINRIEVLTDEINVRNLKQLEIDKKKANRGCKSENK